MPPIDLSYIAEFGQSDVDQRQYSTLDLCPMTHFTLITTEDSSWRARFEQLMESSSSLPLRLVAVNVDFSFMNEPRAMEWVKGFGLEHGGAVLVRPDQHVLTVFNENTSVGEVVNVLHGYLGLPF